jgi:hypothetical protein
MNLICVRYSRQLILDCAGLHDKTLVPFSSHIAREEGQTRSAAAHIHHSLFHSITCFQIADNVEVDGIRSVIGDFEARSLTKRSHGMFPR